MRVSWPEQIATPRIGIDRLRFATAPGEDNIREHQRVDVQRTNGGLDVHGGEVPNASAYRLGLNMQVRLSRVSRVSNSGNLLADLDLITNLHLDATRAEMCEHQKAPTTNVNDDVVAALVVAVRRSDLLVWPALLDERHAAVGGGQYGLEVDVVARQLGTSRLVGAAGLLLQNVKCVTLSRGVASKRTSMPPRNAIKKTM